MPSSVSELHLEESALLRLAVDDLSPTERDGAERHLQICAACREAFRSSELLDAALRAAGRAVAVRIDEASDLSATDPFGRRPEPRFHPTRPGAEARSLAETAAGAVPAARELASRLSNDLDDDSRRGPALEGLNLEMVSDRLALAFALDGALAHAEEDAPRRERIATAVLERLSSEAEECESPVDRVIPVTELKGRALLLAGAASLFSGDFGEAEARVLAAWRAFGEGRVSEPLLARTEVFEALRRVAEGWWADAEYLAARASEIFLVTGAEADGARATFVSGLAAWGSGRNRKAATLLRKAALAFGRARAWGGFVTAGVATALCLAVGGRVEDSRRAFRDLRRRKIRRAPLSERMFVRETERIALLLVREPKEAGGPAFRFSPSNVLLLRAASVLAERVVAAGRESDEKLEAALRALEGNPARAFALLYACLKGNALVSQDPLRARELAEAVFNDANDVSLTAVPREIVQAEAKILESAARNQLGYAREARVDAARVRKLFRDAKDVGFGFALADYYEGSAASFAKEYVAGERFLKKALNAFASFCQDDLMGRAEGALGTLYYQRGDEDRALPYLDRAIEMLAPVEDVRYLTASLNNRGQALARLSRFDEARASLVRALMLARKLRSCAHLHTIRTGLAELDFRRGRFTRALHAFIQLGREAAEAGWRNDVVFDQLYVSECLGRLGRQSEMADSIAALRASGKVSPFELSTAMEELFACLDKGMLDADLVGRVRSYLEHDGKGIQREYCRLQIAG